MLPPGKLVSQFVASFVLDLPEEDASYTNDNSTVTTSTTNRSQCTKCTKVVDYVAFLNAMNKLSRRCTNITDDQVHGVMEQIIDRADPRALLAGCKEKDNSMTGK
jgi:hypothetical protein